MAEFDCGETFADFLPFDISHIMNKLIPQSPTTETTEERPAEEDTDSQNRAENDCSHIDISAALRSVALNSWNVSRIETAPELFSVPDGDEDDSPAASLNDRDTSEDGEEDSDEEDGLTVTFQSKYIHIFPLYQDYSLLAVKKDLHKLDKSFLSELLTPSYLQGLQSRLSPGCHGEPGLQSPAVTPSSPSAQPIRVTPCTLWHDLHEVKASGLLSGLTAKEICLQESMFELIGSEASYLRSLAVAVDHFHASKALKRTLTQREHHILFSNICPIRAASERFLMDLEMRLGESVIMSEVGDIVLQHCPEFHDLYVPYVTNMMYQEALVNQLLQQNKDFVYSLKQLESEALCQRQNLKSFLILPFQRITRIKLLLENILKLVEADSRTVSNLEKAIETIHEIVAECNNGVRKMKQIEELVCLEMLLDFGKVKSIPVVTSGRFLVHHGPARQLSVEGSHVSRPSFTSIYLHLFSDLLIISSKRYQRFAVADHVQFPRHVRVEHLKTEMLSLPADSFLLHLSHSQTGRPTAMILVAHTKSDKDKWMKLLSSAQ